MPAYVVILTADVRAVESAGFAYGLPEGTPWIISCSGEEAAVAIAREMMGRAEDYQARLEPQPYKKGQRERQQVRLGALALAKDDAGHRQRLFQEYRPLERLAPETARRIIAETRAWAEELQAQQGG